MKALYQRKRPARGPRQEEIDFLRELAYGPRPVTDGPLGRCLKKGWCTMVSPDREAARETDGRVLYAITPEGLHLISQADS